MKPSQLPPRVHLHLVAAVMSGKWPSRPTQAQKHFAFRGLHGGLLPSKAGGEGACGGGLRRTAIWKLQPLTWHVPGCTAQQRPAASAAHRVWRAIWGLLRGQGIGVHRRPGRQDQDVSAVEELLRVGRPLGAAGLHCEVT